MEITSIKKFKMWGALFLLVPVVRLSKVIIRLLLIVSDFRKMCGICAVFNLNGSNNGGGMTMKVSI